MNHQTSNHDDSFGHREHFAHSHLMVQYISTLIFTDSPQRSSYIIFVGSGHGYDDRHMHFVWIYIGETNFHEFANVMCSLFDCLSYYDMQTNRPEFDSK